MRRILAPSRLALLTALLSLLTACSSILPARAPAPELYQLSPVTVQEAGKTLAVQIVVESPLASRGLDTDRILIRENANEVKYLAGVRWSDRAPRLVQSALIQGLESAKAFTGVGRPQDGLRTSFALLSELRAFDIVSAGGLLASTHVQVTLAAKLVRSPGGDVVATKLFSQDLPASGRSNSDVVATFDEAVKALATDTVSWVVETARPLPKAAQAAAPAAATPEPAATP